MAEGRTAGGRAGGRAVHGEESDTRAKVIDAAVACILEQGFYRATSNEIARRAGVTWGVIQHYFGTRERLLLAVLDDATRRFSDTVDSATITGDTPGQRLFAYLSVLASYYGEPSYLASLQVVLNLTHDPATSEETIRTLIESTERTTSRVNELTAQVLGGTSADPVLESLLFHACRGLALSHLILATRPPQVTRPDAPGGRFEEHAPLLVDALASLVERTSGRSPPVEGPLRPASPERPGPATDPGPGRGPGQSANRSDRSGRP